ncbi:hypothetical protein [Henriciella litoralis]|uniref:hypothetical protein n=1 Tax=Henriciella litoralis TaxID=568102 RepID=UPI0009FFEAF5|nr:hypothetical protein [Henriciella litoralis]
MQASRGLSLLVGRGPRRRLVILAASFLINGTAVWLATRSLGTSSFREPEPAEVIPVTLVEAPPEREPEPEPPEPEPSPPEPDPDPPEPQQPRSEVEPPAPPTEASDTPLRSPIIAAPGETADAGVVAAEEERYPELTLPGPGSDPETQATAALRAFQCNRMGQTRPAWCDDDAPDAIEAPVRPAFAEEPTMSPKALADFEIKQVDEKLRRLMAEDCPPKRGVINDVFTEEHSYLRQGVHAAVGALSANSTNKSCP